MNRLKLFILILLAHQSVILTSENSTISDNKELWVTVFIHGSFSLRPHLNIRNIIKMLTDSIEESVYYRSTEINRRDPFFYKNQAIAGLGLHRVDIDHPHNNAAAPILAASFEEISKHVGNAPSNQYYTFGWSGLVSNKLRYLESAFLHQDLEVLIKKLKDEGYNPKIRIIGYSHGGNLALQLGALHTTKPISSQFSIDELIIIGTPIQVETDYLINSPIFKKVYNFYSRADKVQTLDFFSFKRFFSRKKFSKRRNFRLPDKLTQIRIKITEYEPKSDKCTFDQLPEDPKLLKKHYKEIDYDPGHFELWFMGWTILTYRTTFPLQPLPVLTFLPIFLHYIQLNPDTPRDLVAHIKPQFNTIEFLPYHMHKKYFKAQFTFMDMALLKHMTHHASKFVPDDYNINIYNQKVYGAINIAEYEWREIKRLFKLEKKNKIEMPASININKNDCGYKGHLPATT
ncbi:MAG TPA: hypothetical protein VLG50_03980 [Candidatus Saccharimonadales bacterium]|nr:hypothetical protein [Candidatus Saccharimonadales bacterium]